MMKPSRIKEMVSQLLHNKKGMRFALTGALCLVAVVALGIVISLRGEGWTRPGMALDCRYAVHVHDDDCYDKTLLKKGEKVLICGQADYVVHEHNDDCYDDGALVCPIEEKAEHKHDDDCYEMVEVLDCGKEEGGGHTHTDACYTVSTSDAVLSCGKEEHEHTADCETVTTQTPLTCGQAEHIHSDGCYSKDEEGNASLTCGEGEHSHGDNCYTEESTTSITCGLEAHSHSSSCYSGGGEESVLSCGKVEQSGSHVHTDGCYKTEKELTCGELELHTHIKSCYDQDLLEKGEEVLTCGQIELKVHEHLDGCFVPADKKAAEEDVSTLDTAVPLDGLEEPLSEPETVRFITKDVDGRMVLTDEDVTFTLSYRDKETNKWIQLDPDADLKQYLGMQFKVDVKLKEGVKINPKDLQECGYQMTYGFPDYFDVDFTAVGSIFDEHGAPIAGITCDENGTVTMDFKHEYVDEKIQGEEKLYNLSFTVNGWFNWDGIGKGPGREDHLFDFPVDVDPTDPGFRAANSDIDLRKGVSSAPIMVRNDDGTVDYYVEYTLTITAGRNGAPSVWVMDSAFKGDADMQSKWLYKNADGQYECYVIGDDQTVEKWEIAQEYEDWGPTVKVHLGDMSKNEVRTLTYKVRLDPVNMEKDIDGTTLTNEAAVFAENTTTHELVQKDKDLENKTINNTNVNMVKRVAPAIRENPDGSLTVSYLIRVSNQNSEHLLDLIVTDSLKDWFGDGTAYVTVAKWLDYLSFENIRFYKGDYSNYYENAEAMETLASGEGTINGKALEVFERYEWRPDKDVSPTSCNGNLEVLLKDLGNESVTIYYEVKVAADAFDKLDTSTFKLHNNVKWETEPGKRGNYTRVEKELKEREWLSKVQDGIVKEDQTIKMEPADRVYSEPGTLDENHPTEFEVKKGYVKYKVKVDGGNVDISSWLMLDKLGGTNPTKVRYVGYVEVTGYKKNADGTRDENSAEHVWLNVNDLKSSFQYTSEGLGFGSEFKEFELNYYVRTVDDDALSQVAWENSFSMDGTIGGEGGDHRHIGTQAVKTTVTGGYSFAVNKQSWYYDPTPYDGPGCTLNYSDGDSHAWSKDNGMLYWVIDVQANGTIPKDTWIQDEGIGNPNRQMFHSDSLVGLYVIKSDSVLNFREEFANFAAFDAAISSGELAERCRKLVQGSDYSSPGIENRKGYGDKLDFKLLQALDLASDEKLYAVIRSDPTEKPGVKPVTYQNKVLSRLPNGATITHNTATYNDNGKAGVNKRCLNAFTKNGGTIKKIVENNTDAVNTTVYWDEEGNRKEIPSGVFVTWYVEANVNGNLQGDFELVDDIPEGMEVVNLMVSNIRNYPGDSSLAPWPCEPVSSTEGWTRHITMDNNGDTYHHYNNYAGWRDEWHYYTNGNQLMWGIRFPASHKEGTVMKEENAYKVTFFVTCRIMDEDVFQDFGEAKAFENNVTIYRKNDAGGLDEWGDSQASVEIERQTKLSKNIIQGASENGHEGKLQFMITVNENAWDISLTDTVTIEDHMSEYLKVDGDYGVRIFEECVVTRDGDGKEVRTFNKPLGADDYQVSIEDGGSTLKISMPDNKKLYVVYDVNVGVPPGESVAISNKVSYLGYTSSDDSETADNDFVYYVGGQIESSGINSKIKIRKTDATNQMDYLEGAEFKLEKVQKWNRITKEYEEFQAADADILTGITNAEGVLAQTNGAVEYIVDLYDIYCLTETKAPTGYMKNADPIYIFVTRDEYADAALKEAEMLYQGQDLRHYGDGFNAAEFFVANTRNEIIGTKLFLDEMGNELKSIPEGTYTFGLYTRDENEEYQPVKRADETHYTAVINVPEDRENGYTFKFENLETDQTYYVFELDENENPITPDSPSWTKTNVTFVTSYSNEDGIKVIGGTSEITVTNRVAGSYKLPATGGAGIAMYTLSGLLIIGAGLLYARKKRPQKQK